MVEAQNRVGGRPGAQDGHVDTMVLVRTDKWCGSGKAWPIWNGQVVEPSIEICHLDTTNADISAW